MLADDVIELLTAYVDGALAPRRQEAVTRLLQRSPEARELVQQLMEDARRLQRLPKHPVEPSLAPDVLAALAPPAPRSRHKRQRWAWKPYLAVGLAACLLLGTVGGIYYATLRPNYPSGGVVVAVTVPTPKQAERPPSVPEVETPKTRPTNPLIAQVVDGVFSQFGAPIPPERGFSLTFGELRGEGLVPAQLAYELSKDRAVHLDVVVKDRSLALDRLRSVFHETGIKIVIDPETDASFQKKAGVGEFWVYAENIKPDELARMLKDLSKDDNKMQAFKKTPFERVTVQALPLAEKQRVSAQLGIAPAALDPRKLPPQPPSNDVSRWNRSAVVLPQLPTGQDSREVREFVSGRHRPQAGAVQLLVKIRVEK